MSTVAATMGASSSALAVVRVPLYFGPTGRALFGWYHAPAFARAPVAAVLLCPPLGHEYINAHRSLRHLADRLATDGVAALRFDYDGTGDSAGHADDPDRLPAWIASVHEASRALRDQSRCDRIGMAGLRMGAMLAAVVSCEIDVDNLILWAPCVRGRTFLREVRALDLTTRANVDPSLGSADFDAGGFLVTEPLQRDIARLDLEDLRPRASRILIAARDDLPEGPGLFNTWTAAGLAVDRQIVPGFRDIIVAPHNTRIPHAAIEAIVGWVVAGNNPKFTPGRPALRAQVHTPLGELALGDVRESVLRFGDSAFGVITEPLAPIDPLAPAVVFSNAGSAHHVGPNRLYVDMARGLAREGFRCLRLDLPGLGDSVVDDAACENIPYVPEASAVIGLALDALSQQRGATRFVLAGLCSGGHTALHAALDLERSPIVESVLINPLTFSYRPGMSLDTSSEPHASRWQRYRRSIGSLRGWSKLFRNEVGVTTIVRDVVTRIGIVRGRWLDALQPRRQARGGALVRTDLGRVIRRLVDQGTNLTMVFSRFDPGHDLLMIQAGREVWALRKDGRVSLWVIDGANHTFDAHGPRADLIRSLTTFLTKRYLRR